MTNEYVPITKGLRDEMAHGSAGNTDVVVLEKTDFEAFCDNIDAIHRSLEEENERLHERLQELDNVDGSMQIGEVTVTITPRIDWTAVADDLRDAAKALCERTREGEE